MAAKGFDTEKKYPPPVQVRQQRCEHCREGPASAEIRPYCAGKQEGAAGRKVCEDAGIHAAAAQ
jgi:hypothetical protein